MMLLHPITVCPGRSSPMTAPLPDKVLVLNKLQHKLHKINIFLKEAHKEEEKGKQPHKNSRHQNAVVPQF